MIELHAVSKTVPSGDSMLTILHPLDLRIESGRVIAITGPSGSGKSTLLGLLAGLDAPSTGRIVIDGADITTMSEDTLARFRGTRIGFVFQFFHLLPSLTAWENVRVPLEIAGTAGAGHRADALLSELASGPPPSLSSAFRWRAAAGAIARALAIRHPAGWRPTGNLDSATGRRVIDLLIDVNRRRKTTVVVTRDAELPRGPTCGALGTDASRPRPLQCRDCDAANARSAWPHTGEPAKRRERVRVATVKCQASWPQGSVPMGPLLEHRIEMNGSLCIAATNATFGSSRRRASAVGGADGGLWVIALTAAM